MSKPKFDAEAPPKSHLLQIRERVGVSQDRQMADVLTEGVATNASAVVAFTTVTMPDTSLTDLVNSLADQGKRVHANDFGQQEQMLNAQANALNAIFGELCRRAALNLGQHLDATERYLRLALKAQGQCRATLETLADIKNPPVVYAKQANIAHGPQQVNNGAMSLPHGEPMPVSAHVETGNQQTKLLAGVQHGGTLMDTGATRTATTGHPNLEAVGAVNRPKDSTGED